MSRLSSTFDRLRERRQTALVTYVTAGDPDLVRSERILRALDGAGADVLEVGVPFSDPVADGPVIQRGTERALAAGSSLAASLDIVARVRPHVAAPIVLFTYVNPVLRLGPERFAQRAAVAGADAVLVLDLPLEEASEFRAVLAARALDMIFLVSPTTTDARIQQAARLASGFVYAISRVGVTGVRRDLPTGAEALVRRVRQRTPLPVALGFGISTPEQVQQAGQWADAAVVGSGLVDLIARSADAPDLDRRVTDYVRWLKGAGVPAS